MDWILLFLIVLFVTTLTAFLQGVIPYPVGIMILGVLIVLRISQRKSRR